MPILLVTPAVVGLLALYVYPLLWEFDVSFTEDERPQLRDPRVPGSAGRQLAANIRQPAADVRRGRTDGRPAADIRQPAADVRRGRTDGRSGPSAVARIADSAAGTGVWTPDSADPFAGGERALGQQWRRHPEGGIGSPAANNRSAASTARANGRPDERTTGRPAFSRLPNQQRKSACRAAAVEPSVVHDLAPRAEQGLERLRPDEIAHEDGQPGVGDRRPEAGAAPRGLPGSPGGATGRPPRGRRWHPRGPRRDPGRAPWRGLRRRSCPEGASATTRASRPRPRAGGTARVSGGPLARGDRAPGCRSARDLRRSPVVGASPAGLRWRVARASPRPYAAPGHAATWPARRRARPVLVLGPGLDDEHLEVHGIRRRIDGTYRTAHHGLLRGVFR